MPAQAHPEVAQVCSSVEQFSEEALEKAIELARDPEKVSAFVDRLRDELDRAKNGFPAIALCVVLGEARVESAIPLLLQQATDADMPLAQEAATYALKRMGAPALEAAIQLVESSDVPSTCVLAYEILQAAVDAPQDMRRRVADVCLKQAEIETCRDWPEDDWNPAGAVCSALVTLKDHRVRPLIEAILGRTSSPADRLEWQQLLKKLKNGRMASGSADWREDWRERCNVWAEYAEDFAEEAEYAAEQQTAHEANANLAREFGDSPYAQKIDDVSAEDAEGEITQFLHMGFDYIDHDFDACDWRDVHELLYEWLPRKVTAEMEYFESFPFVLEAFVRFLHASGRLAEPGSLLALAEEARVDLPRLAADSANWGFAKSMLMGSFDAAFDLGKARSARQFDLPQGHRLDSAPSLVAGDPVDVVPSIHRLASKVGRNDPCPCGSGRKYKKCCGKR